MSSDSLAWRGGVHDLVTSREHANLSGPQLRAALRAMLGRSLQALRPADLRDAWTRAETEADERRDKYAANQDAAKRKLVRARAKLAEIHAAKSRAYHDVPLFDVAGAR